MDIEFQQSEYTFSEKDGVGEVCLITSHGTTYDFSVTLRSELHRRSAQGQPNLVYKMLTNLNYWYIMYAAGVDFNISDLFLTLEPGDSIVCMNETLLEDTLVEGTEWVKLSFQNIDPHIILNADTIYDEYEFTWFAIKDSTGMCCHI